MTYRQNWGQLRKMKVPTAAPPLLRIQWKMRTRVCQTQQMQLSFTKSRAISDMNEVKGIVDDHSVLTSKCGAYKNKFISLFLVYISASFISGNSFHVYLEANYSSSSPFISVFYGVRTVRTDDQLAYLLFFYVRFSISWTQRFIGGFLSMISSFVISS